MKSKFFHALFLSVLVSIGFTQASFAQRDSAQNPTANIVQTYAAQEDVEATEGAVLAKGIDGRLILATEPYAKGLFGVVAETPAVVLEKNAAEAEGEIQVPVATSGEARVRVSGHNGSIRAGDFLTSSKIPGVAMKADVSGMVIGIALEGFSGGLSEEGMITVLIKIEYIEFEENGLFNLPGKPAKSFDLLSLPGALSTGIALFTLIAGLVLMTGVARSFVEHSSVQPQMIESFRRNVLANYAGIVLFMLFGFLAAFIVFWLL